MRDTLTCLSTGASYQEIADMYGVCVGAIKSRKSEIIRVIGHKKYMKAVYKNGGKELNYSLLNPAREPTLPKEHDHVDDANGRAGPANPRRPAGRESEDPEAA